MERSFHDEVSQNVALGEMHCAPVTYLRSWDPVALHGRHSDSWPRFISLALDALRYGFCSCL